MIISEEDYLEHFGMKGMKWGIRNKRDQWVGGKGKHQAVVTRENKRHADAVARETSRQKGRPSRRERQIALGKKLSIVVGVTATAVGGALIAKKLLGRSAGLKLRDIPKPPPAIYSHLPAPPLFPHLPSPPRRFAPPPPPLFKAKKLANPRRSNINPQGLGMLYREFKKTLPPKKKPIKNTQRR